MPDRTVSVNSRARQPLYRGGFQPAVMGHRVVLGSAAGQVLQRTGPALHEFGVGAFPFGPAVLADALDEDLVRGRRRRQQLERLLQVGGDCKKIFLQSHSATKSWHPCARQGFESTIVGARVEEPVGYDVSAGAVSGAGLVSKILTPFRVTLASHGAGCSATRVSMSSQ